MWTVKILFEGTTVYEERVKSPWIRLPVPPWDLQVQLIDRGGAIWTATTSPEPGEEVELVDWQAGPGD